MGSPELNIQPSEAQVMPFPMPEAGKPRHISYKEFKRTENLPSLTGVVIDNVKPTDLFVSQDWTSSSKVFTVYNGVTESKADSDERFLLEGYVSQRPIPGRSEKQKVIVLPDGHHRALCAWEQGKKVDVFVLREKPSGNYHGLSTLRSSSGAIFRDLV